MEIVTITEAGAILSSAHCNLKQNRICHALTRPWAHHTWDITAACIIAISCRGYAIHSNHDGNTCMKSWRPSARHHLRQSDPYARPANRTPQAGCRPRCDRDRPQWEIALPGHRKLPPGNARIRRRPFSARHHPNRDGSAGACRPGEMNAFPFATGLFGVQDELLEKTFLAQITTQRLSSMETNFGAKSQRLQLDRTNWLMKWRRRPPARNRDLIVSTGGDKPLPVRYPRFAKSISFTTACYAAARFVARRC